MIRFRPLLGPTLWTIPALALLIGLGIWQVQRLHWKEALIAAVATRIHAPPVSLDEALRLPPDLAEYRNVEVTGRFLHDREAYLFAQGPGGQPGVHVLTPLMLDTGLSVIIDRGFVPDALHDPATRAAGQIDGQTTVRGILRYSQQPRMFTPPPDLTHRLWFLKEVPPLAAQMGIRPKANVVVEADASPNPGGWPLGGQSLVDFPNDHLQYALTWFGLALTLLVVYLVYHHSRGRLRIG